LEALAAQIFKTVPLNLMFEALQKLKALPDETVVFPGHDYHEKRSSTITQEKQDNPFLREVK